MPTLRLSLAGLLLMGLAGCTLPAGDPSERPTYFPMEANRLWEYRLQDFGKKQTWPIAVQSRGPQFLPKLGRVVAIFDEEYPDQVLPVAFFLAEGFLHSEISLGYGIGREMEQMPIGTQPMRIMPVPPRIGMHWSYSEDVFALTGRLSAGILIHWTGDIEGMESVEVPAGVFRDCLRVVSVANHRTALDANAGYFRYVDWYAPDVGLVKSEYYFGNETMTITRLELVRFRRGATPPAPGATGLQMAALARRN